ncbi:MAG: hypothetical protein Q9163_005351 [Psora crenata]
MDSDRTASSTTLPFVTTKPSPTSLSDTQGASTSFSTSNTTSGIYGPTKTASCAPSSIISAAHSNYTGPATSPAPSLVASTASSTTSSVFTAASAASSSPPPPNPILTRPQLAGVIVASVGATALAFGLCIFLLCFRRKRRQRRHSDSSFGGDKIVDTPGITPDMAAVAAEHSPPGDQPWLESLPVPSSNPVKPAHPTGRDWQQWDRTTDSRKIGLAVGPGIPRPPSEGPSPITPGSHRTNSQLLPEKPLYSLFPQPLRTDPNSGGPSRNPRPQASNGYAPDMSPPMAGPSFPSSMDTSQAHLQDRTWNRSLSDPFYHTPQGPPSQGYTGIPRSALSATVGEPLPANPSPGAPVIITPPSWSQRAPPPPPKGQPYLAGIQRQHSRKRPARKKSNSSSQYTRFSNGSETSFEDADEELLSPQKSALSPVAEVRSPPQRSPKIVYHSMPISASESSKRVINKYGPTPHQAGPLLTKRGDGEKAAELSSDSSPVDVRRSAKWKILVSPGLEALDGSTLGSSRSAVRTTPDREMMRVT